MKIVNIRSLLVIRLHGVANLPANFSKQFSHYITEIILDPWVVCARVCVCVFQCVGWRSWWADEQLIYLLM